MVGFLIHSVPFHGEPEIEESVPWVHRMRVISCISKNAILCLKPLINNIISGHFTTGVSTQDYLNQLDASRNSSSRCLS